VRKLGPIAQLALVAILFGSFGCGMKSKRGTAAVDMKELTGTVSYRERIALPPDAVVDVRLDDVSGKDGAAIVISEVTFEPRRQVPIPFTLEYPPYAIDDRNTYAVRATIRRGDTLLFVTDTPALVLTSGRGARVDLVLVPSAGGEAGSNAVENR
jgi:putative lipoprotein